MHFMALEVSITLGDLLWLAAWQASARAWSGWVSYILTISRLHSSYSLIPSKGPS